MNDSTVRPGGASKREKTFDLSMRKPSRVSAFVAGSVVVFALFCALVTFSVLTGLTSVEPRQHIIAAALAINGLLCVVLIALIFREIWPLWRARRAGKAAARLHGRVVAMFCGLAAVPAILVAVIAIVTLDVGLDRWFSTRTRAIVDNAMTVSRAYLRDHTQTIRDEVLLMAQEINRAALISAASFDARAFQAYLKQQSIERTLPAVYLLRSDGSILLSPMNETAREYSLPAKETIQKATSTTEPVLLTPQGSHLVGAIIKLQALDDTYLYVARPVDENVLRYLQETEDASREYHSLDLRRTGVQVAFALTYASMAFILLLGATWFGMAFANRLVAPIRRLIGAADQVSQGNLNVQVPVRPEEGDLAHLGQTFNTMTNELNTQRNDLLRANAQMDARRLFTEAVLSGVTAGIIGIDPQLRITLVNPTALALIGEEEGAVIGQPLAKILPELADLLAEAEAHQRLTQGEIVLRRRSKEHNLLVRVTGEETTSSEHGYVVTLDDITDLVTAQRSSAWADVARRIAHEIKNPLTPIQLSAERLKRKYGKSIGDKDRDVFDQCTETIIRQVNDIGRMVDEFSSFARMPKAQIHEEDIGDLVRQVVFLMRVGNPDINFVYRLPEDMIRAEVDRRLISQAVTNLLKNASEAITIADKNSTVKGRVNITVQANENDQVVIAVEDNGIGLPSENRQRLLEPYMTTREKGTGLGLAIVGKIMDDHGGSVELLDGHGTDERRGAIVQLVFPRQQIRNTTPAEAVSKADFVSAHGK